MSVDAALAAVRAQRPSAQPNAGFMRQLAQYEASFRPTCGLMRGDVIVVEPALTSGQTAGQTSGAHCGSAPLSEAASAAPGCGPHLKASQSGCQCRLPPCMPQDEQDSHSPPFRQPVEGNAVAGVAIDMPSGGHVQAGECEAWEKGPSQKADDPWVSGASISPQAVCGAASMAAARGGRDEKEEDDPAPSPQSSAGDCGSSRGTPRRSAAVSEDWDIPAFSLDDCGPCPDRSLEGAA